MAFFAQPLDYFAPSSRFNAFTHTWSLGVEEQFYIVFPLFAWLFYFRLKDMVKWLLPAALAFFSLISVALFVRLYADHQAAAYFLM